jgi:hypothetical protein
MVLFKAPWPKSKKFEPACKFLLDYSRDLFRDNYICFREILTVFLSKYLTAEDVENPKIFLDSMNYELEHSALTLRHYEAYFSIFRSLFAQSAESAELLFSLFPTLVGTKANLFGKLVELTLMKAPPVEAFTIAATLLQCRAGTNKSISVTKPVIKNVIVTEICRWLRQYIKSVEVIEDGIMDLVTELFAIQKPQKPLARAVFQVVVQIVKRAKEKEFEKIDDFRNKCEAWFAKCKDLLGAIEYGRCSADLQMLVARQKGEKDDRRQVKHFVARKWRSPTKFINDGLRDETDSDDNFGDLEGFIVDESPTNSDDSGVVLD